MALLQREEGNALRLHAVLLELGDSFLSPLQISDAFVWLETVVVYHTFLPGCVVLDDIVEVADLAENQESPTNGRETQQAEL